MWGGCSGLAEVISCGSVRERSGHWLTFSASMGIGGNFKPSVVDTWVGTKDQDIEIDRKLSDISFLLSFI